MEGVYIVAIEAWRKERKVRDPHLNSGRIRLMWASRAPLHRVRLTPFTIPEG